MIEDLIKNKTAKERANIKSKEIAKLDFRGEYINMQYGVKIDIQSIKAVEGGVEIYARGWKGVKQLGFGKDGSVEIERFVIINPPIMVDDPNGDVIREFDYEGTPMTRRLREDPAEAIRQDLAHTISLVGKENTNIVKGKIGKTCLTVHPAAGTGGGGSPIDAFTRRDNNEGFDAKHDGAGTVSPNLTSGAGFAGHLLASTTLNQYDSQSRYCLGFDTSSIGTSDIDSAKLSLKPATGFLHTVALGDIEANFVAHTPVAEDTYQTADYNIAKFGSTKLATGILIGTLNATLDVYHNWTLNASGEAHINKSGNTMFGISTEWDLDDDFQGTWSSGDSTGCGVRSADASGTASDPKLVVEHSSVFIPQAMFI